MVRSERGNVTKNLCSCLYSPVSSIIIPKVKFLNICIKVFVVPACDYLVRRLKCLMKYLIQHWGKECNVKIIHHGIQKRINRSCRFIRFFIRSGSFVVAFADTRFLISQAFMVEFNSTFFGGLLVQALPITTLHTNDRQAGNTQQARHLQSGLCKN